MIKKFLCPLFFLIVISVNGFGKISQAPGVGPLGIVHKAESPAGSTWLVKAIWEDLEKEEDLGLLLEFKKGKIIAKSGGEEQEASSYVIDPVKKRLVITTNDKEIVNVIYKIENDVLTMCYREEAKDFPKTFDPAEGKLVLKLIRLKPIDAKFQGKWECIESWQDGEKADADEVEELSFLISGYELEFFDGVEQEDEDGNKVEPDEAFIISVDEKLKRMLLNDGMGDNYHCIYELKDDVLTIHFYSNMGEEGGNADYPKDFKITEDSVLFRLKRMPAK